MKHEQQVSEIQGAYSAVFTPFDTNNEVNLDRLTEIVAFQIDQGIGGFFATGSTGEGLLLSFEERVSVFRQVVQAANGRAKVIAHVGHPSSDVAARLAVAAADVGVDWIAAVGPIYHGTTFEGAMRHYRQISNATDLPFMVYSLNGIVDPRRDVAFFEMPNVCGMKYTGANFFSVQQLAANVQRPLALMSGFDEQFVASLSFGFAGGIGSTYNFAPRFYSQIYRSYRDGDIQRAAEVQAEINRVTQLMVQHENWSYAKSIMRYIGLDCGPARGPFAPLTEEEYHAFAGQLDLLGVLTREQ